jgi:cutinase
MSPDTAKHVAAVVLFGKPSSGFLQMIYTGAPPITVGKLYTGKTLDLCIPEDNVCSPSGNDNNAHTGYAENGMAIQAADYVMDRLSSNGSRT